MKFTRTLALIFGVTLVVSACDRDADEALVSVAESANPLLAHVPADTSYVFASLEPVPKEITDVYVARFQPVLDVMSKHVSKFKADYAAGEFENDQMARLASAILDELGGEVSAESLENLGISLQTNSAFYASGGVFPVMRISLADTGKLREAIARVETKMGFTLPEKDLNGTSYWHVAESGMPVGVYIAILDQHLAMSVFPVSAEDKLLPAFLGQDMPVDSMAATNALAIMNSEKGYTGYGSGIVNLQKLANEMLDENSATHAYLGPELSMHMQSFDPVCVAEIKSMIDKAPRMTMGTTRMSANEIGMRYELEIENSLASGLLGLVSDTPAALEGNQLVSASLAVKVGKLRNFLLEKATAVAAAPYQCEQFEKFNQSAEEMVAQLNIPMPPMVNNLMGVRVSMDEFDPKADIVKGKGLVALHVDKPEMFVGMASMMVPGFDALDLANQTQPVRIPESILRMEGLEVFALMGDSAIGASVGEENAGDLEAFMNLSQPNNGTFLSVSYDMAKQLEIEAAMKDTLQYSSEHAAHEYADAVKEAYTAMLGRSRVEMRFTTGGLVIDNNVTFK
jgi:hypothetical protein